MTTTRTLVRLVFLLFPLLIAGPELAAGEFSWAKHWGGNLVGDAVVDSAGNIYTVGEFFGTADFDPGPSVLYLTAGGGTFADVFVTKLDHDGRLVWAKSFGGVGRADEANSIAIDASGDLYITGFFEGSGDFDPGPGTFQLTSAGESDVFILKLDGSGDFLWAKQVGGLGRDRAVSVELDNSGFIYANGDFEGTVDFDPGLGTLFLTSAGLTDVFVSKLDAAGNFLWAARVGGGDWDTARGMAVSDSGKVYSVGGYLGTVDFDPGPGVTELTVGGGFILKLESTGAFGWVAHSGGSAVRVAVDDDGNVYSTGTFWGTADFDPGPGVLNLTSAGSEDLFVSKLDPSGNLSWAFRMGTIHGEDSFGVRLGPNGHVHLAGRFFGNLDLDPGPEMFTLKSGPTVGNFVLTLDAAGQFVWAGHVTGDVVIAGVEADSNGALHVFGEFQGTVDFDPGPAVSERTANSSSYDAFVVRLERCGLFVEQNVYGWLLFRPSCSVDAGGLSQDEYDSTSVTVVRNANERFYLSSRGEQLASLVVDDAVRINGVDAGLGLYSYRPGVPPLLVDVPVEHNFVPQPAPEITSLIPEGTDLVRFELLDVDREVYGNSAVYFLRDCGIWMEQDVQDSTRLHWVSHEVQVLDTTSDLEIVSGSLSQLRSDGNLSQACFWGNVFNATEAVIFEPDPPSGDGYYYLVNGTCGSPIGYGNSSQGPRQGLPPVAPCVR